MTINDIKDQPPVSGTATTTLAQDSAPGIPPITKMQKRVLAGGSIGQFIEFYDFTLYGLTAVILSPALLPGQQPPARPCWQPSPRSASRSSCGRIGGLFFGAWVTGSADAES